MKQLFRFTALFPHICDAKKLGEKNMKRSFREFFRVWPLSICSADCPRCMCCVFVSLMRKHDAIFAELLLALQWPELPTYAEKLTAKGPCAI